MLSTQIHWLIKLQNGVGVLDCTQHQEVGAEGQKFKAILGYIASLKPAWDSLFKKKLQNENP